MTRNRSTTAPVDRSISQRRSAAQKAPSEAYRTRRRELIKAAGEVFRERGYNDTSFDEIAKKVNTDRATLYYYFSGRQELFYEVIHEAVESLTTDAEAIRAAGTSSVEKLRAIIRSLMTHYDKHYPYAYVYVQEDMVRVATGETEWAKEMRSLGDRYERALVDIIKDGVKAGELKSLRPGIAAHGLIGMVSWTHRWYQPGGRASAEEITETFATIFLDGFALPG